MGSSSSQPKRKKPRRYLIVCGRPMCGGDAVFAKKPEPTETVDDIIERRQSMLQAYAASQRDNSPAIYDGDEDDDSDSTSAGASYGKHVRRIDNFSYDKNADMTSGGKSRTALMNPLHPHRGSSRPEVEQKGDTNSTSDEDEEDSSSSSGARTSSSSQVPDLGDFGLDVGDILVSDSSTMSSSTNSTLSDSSEQSEDQPEFDKWNRPIYIPLSESERLVVREARRKRSVTIARSQAGQMARRGGIKEQRPIRQDLSTGPVEDQAPMLRRRSSSIRFTEAVVVGSATSSSGATTKTPA